MRFELAAPIFIRFEVRILVGECPHLVSSIKVEVKKKHISFGWSFLASQP